MMAMSRDEEESGRLFRERIQTVLKLVEAHRPWDEIAQTPCPLCGGGLKLEFCRDGSLYSVICLLYGGHRVDLVSINSPPPWWKEHVEGYTEGRLVWVGRGRADAKGTFRLNFSEHGYENGWAEHRTGSIIVTRDDPDYAFWHWLNEKHKETPELVSDQALAGLKEEFARRLRPEG